ncbi:hypothetical protein BGX27_009039 [Mortierella sp. AM989]|nr:hypothetical protein BGX27_009039 [Mortierella sp. AM989]
MKQVTESKNSSSFEVVPIDGRIHVEASISDIPLEGTSQKESGIENIAVCDSVPNCLFYSTQGWPAMGEQTVDLLVMSYASGSISVVGGILGAFGIYAAYKESAFKVHLFARAWRFMIGMFIGSTILTLFLTVIHKERFLSQCFVEHDSVLGTSDCGVMYAAALLGSLVGCLIGVAMILCYCGDVVKYSVQLENAEQKTRCTDNYSS